MTLLGGGGGLEGRTCTSGSLSTRHVSIADWRSASQSRRMAAVGVPCTPLLYNGPGYTTMYYNGRGSCPWGGGGPARTSQDQLEPGGVGATEKPSDVGATAKQMVGRKQRGQL